MPALTAPSRNVASRSARGVVFSVRHRDLPVQASRNTAANVSRSHVVPAGPSEPNSSVASALPVCRAAMAMRTSAGPGIERGPEGAVAPVIASVVSAAVVAVTRPLDRPGSVSVHGPMVDASATFGGQLLDDE